MSWKWGDDIELPSTDAQPKDIFKPNKPKLVRPKRINVDIDWISVNPRQLRFIGDVSNSLANKICNCLNVCGFVFNPEWRMWVDVNDLACATTLIRKLRVLKVSVNNKGEVPLEWQLLRQRKSINRWRMDHNKPPI